MKKWIAFMLVFVLALVLAGCKDNGPVVDDDNKNIKVTIEGNSATMNVGEEMQLTAKIDPATAEQSVVWSTKDDKIATVSQDGKVKAIAAGIVEIVATSTVNNRASKSVQIQVIKPIEYQDPTGVEIVGTQKEFRVNSSINLTAKVFPLADDTAGTAGAIQTVTWTSSDEAVATVNSAGRVTGVAIGDAIITAIVVEDPTLTATFDIKVTQGTVGEVPVEPEEVRVSGETSVEEGYQIALIASVLPIGVSQNVTWSSETPEFATVTSRGIVTGIKAGAAIIRVQSNVDLTIERFYQITVNPKVPMPDPTNMNDYKIVIMAAPHALAEHDPKLDGYKGLDKQAKLDAWAEVQDLFNAQMVVEPFPTTAPWGSERIKWIIEKSELNAAETDIFVSTTDWVVQFANANATVDVLEFYNKYGKGSMDPGVKAASSYKGKLYALPTSGVGSIMPYHGLFFNVNLLNSLGLENPAQLFNEGKWTWSGFEKYVKDAAALLAEDQSVLSGKPAGLYYGMASAAGVKLVDPTTMTLNFTHGHAINAANLIRDLYVVENVWGDNAWDAQNPSFNTGKSIFQVAEYWFLKDSGRFRVDMWGEGTTKYGYVPFPYPDAMSKDETRVSYQGGAIYQMSSGRVYPSGITVEDVYRVFTSMMLGTTQKMHADPEMNEDVLMRRAAEFKLDDQESITAITFFKSDKVIWDPFYSILPSWSHAGRMIDDVVVTGTDYMQVVDTYDPQFRTALNDIYG